MNHPAFQANLKKFAGAAVLAGALGMASMGLGAGTANADPTPAPGPPCQGACHPAPNMQMPMAPGMQMPMGPAKGPDPVQQHPQ